MTGCLNIHLQGPSCKEVGDRTLQPPPLPHNLATPCSCMNLTSQLHECKHTHTHTHSYTSRQSYWSTGSDVEVVVWAGRRPVQPYLHSSDRGRGWRRLQFAATFRRREPTLQGAAPRPLLSAVSVSPSGSPIAGRFNACALYIVLRPCASTVRVAECVLNFLGELLTFNGRFRYFVTCIVVCQTTVCSVSCVLV